MRLLRLAILGESPCHLCAANCCKQNGHDWAVLLEPSEYSKFGPFSRSVTFDDNGLPRTERILPYVNGRCQFLAEDNLCTIYEDRPNSCRRFQCIPGYNHGGSAPGEHSRFLQRNPTVLRILENL